jgi:hypothetical protein
MVCGPLSEHATSEQFAEFVGPITITVPQRKGCRWSEIMAGQARLAPRLLWRQGLYYSGFRANAFAMYVVSWSNMRLSGWAVHKLLGLSLRSTGAIVRCRAAQLWR